MANTYHAEKSRRLQQILNDYLIELKRGEQNKAAFDDIEELIEDLAGDVARLAKAEG